MILGLTPGELAKERREAGALRTRLTLELEAARQRIAELETELEQHQ